MNVRVSFNSRTLTPAFLLLLTQSHVPIAFQVKTDLLVAARVGLGSESVDLPGTQTSSTLGLKAWRIV